MTAVPSYPIPAPPTTPSRQSLPVRFSSIPVSLRSLPQWVVWRLEWNDDEQRWKKPPFDPRTRRYGSHSAPSTWASFSDAMAAYLAGGFDGVGFAFAPTDRYFGCDLDDCRDPLSGVIAPWALDIIRELATYTEISPSATGVKLIGYGDLPPEGRVHKRFGRKIEIYDAQRYFTITGHRIDGAPAEPMDRQAEVTAFHLRLFPPSSSSAKSAAGSAVAVQTTAQGTVLSDAEVVSLLLAKPADRQLWEGSRSLWTGKKPRCASQSEADAALIARIARITSDPAQIDRLFRLAGLMRPKWDAIHSTSRETYGGMSIRKALETTRPLRIDFGIPPAGWIISLGDYFSKLVVSRATTTNGISLDRSPCGAGKTHALLNRLPSVPSSLIVCPTHENCGELVLAAQQRGIDAAAHPQPTSENCEQFTRVLDGQRSGLPIDESVCPSCQAKFRCGRYGYRKEVARFRKAAHQIVTHERATKVGLETLASGKSLIVVQERVENFLSSSVGVNFGELDQLGSPLAESAERAGQSPETLPIRNYAWHLSRVLALIGGSRQQEAPHRIVPGLPPVTPPDGWYAALHDSLKSTGGRLSADALHGLMDLAAGRAEAIFRPERRVAKGGHAKQIVFLRRNRMPERVPVILEDHTARTSTISELVGKPVRDMTSVTFPEALHRVAQMPVDVTKGTTAKSATDLVRGILLTRPAAQRVGVICHSNHRTAIEKIESPFRERIAIVDYFWSGNSRASNRWHEECELLLVLGTPRPGIAAVQESLLRMGLLEAAKRDGDFTESIAIGHTETGERRVYLSRRYSEPEWDSAYRSLVVPEIVQSIGRARYIRPEGIPETILVSTEPTGIPVLERDVLPISETEASVCFALSRMALEEKPSQSPASHRGGGIPTRLSRGEARIASSIYSDFRAPTIASEPLPREGIGYKRLSAVTGKSPSTVRGILRRLSEAGLTAKCSTSGYWPIVLPD